MSKEMSDRYKNDEIDLIDIMAVLIKRKWVIIGLLLTALILSGAYVAFLREINYKANIIITPPQEYNIITPPQEYKVGQNSRLLPSSPLIDTFTSTIKKSFSSQIIKGSNAAEEQYYTYDVNVTEDINIHITGKSEKIIVDAILPLYNLYINFENTINRKNKKIFKLTQDSLENALIQKREMIKNLSLILNTKTLSKLPAGSENAILYMINTLSSDITKIEIIKGFNEELELSKGSFILAGSGSKEIVVDHDNLGNLGPYITPEKSRKRQLLPVIISVFLALFVGIFLAFIIEFFSREDVKKRLKEIKNK